MRYTSGNCGEPYTRIASTVTLHFDTIIAPSFFIRMFHDGSLASRYWWISCLILFRAITFHASTSTLSIGESLANVFFQCSDRLLIESTQLRRLSRLGPSLCAGNLVLLVVCFGSQSGWNKTNIKTLAHITFELLVHKETDRCITIATRMNPFWFRIPDPSLVSYTNQVDWEPNHQICTKERRRPVEVVYKPTTSLYPTGEHYHDTVP